MVRGAILALVVVAGVPAAARAAERLDIAQLASTWPSRFTLSGTKTEPTYVEQVSVTRDGDIFILSGGAPAGMAQSGETIAVAADGQMTVLACPAAMNCAPPLRPSGFLATAAIVAAARRGNLVGRVEAIRFGAFRVVCVPAEALGVSDPVLDPCVEIKSGAVLAQRHRITHRFDGPSLDPWSIELATAKPISN
jgi:hypothetical protein